MKNSLQSSLFETKDHFISLLFVGFIVAGTGFCMGLIGPLLEIVLKSKGFSDIYILASVATIAFAYTTTTPFVPSILRKFQPRHVFVISLLILALCVVATYYTERSDALIGIRYLIGIATAFIFIIGNSSISYLSPPAKRGVILGLYGSAISLGYALGPLLLDYLPIHTLFPFLMCAGFLIIFSLLAFRVKKMCESDVNARTNKGIALVLLVPLALVAAIGFGVNDESLDAALPIYGLLVGLTPKTASLLVSVYIIGSIVLESPLGWLGDKIGYGKTLLVSLSLIILTLLVIWSEHEALFYTWPMLFIAGGALSSLESLGQALLAERFDKKLLVSANAGFEMFSNMPGIFFPLIVGRFLEKLGPSSFILLLFTTNILVLGAVIYYRRTSKESL